ncbi:MAG: class I SAM-dependent methyltransferase [Streptococcaceae bacterium]|nr:class I SAM-dependent methyltransferase [Streptococcaceae bacterium]
MAKNYEKLSADYYNRQAARFERSFDGFLAGFFKRYIVKQLDLETGAAVLDVGSATGKLLQMLAQKSAIEGTGLDIAPRMTELAQVTYPAFAFVTGSAMQLPFAAQQFDVIICSASFHHFPEPERFLAEALRTLKPGGRLVIAEIRIPVGRRLYNALIGRFSKEGDVKVYDFDELQQLLERADFIRLRGRKQLQIQYFEAYKRQ